MKKIILIGNVACGKTTLCQCLNGLELSYKKTQALEVVQQTIDTPGEYLEHRSFLQALIVTSVEADLALFVQDATQERYMFSRGRPPPSPSPWRGSFPRSTGPRRSRWSRPGSCWLWQGRTRYSPSAPSPGRGSASCPRSRRIR